MKKDTVISFAKYKKIHAALTGIIVFSILIKALGVDFFLFDFANEAEHYSIKIDQLDEIMLMLFLNNMKNTIIIFVLLRLKHGDVYKYIVLSFSTIMALIMMLNISRACTTMSNIFSAIILYMPGYINWFFYVMLLENTEHLINKYNNSSRVGEEVKILIRLAVVVVSSIVLLSFIHAVMAVMII